MSESYDVRVYNKEYCGINAINNIFKNYPLRLHNPITIDFIKSIQKNIEAKVKIPEGHVHVGAKGAIHINVVVYLIQKYCKHNLVKMEDKYINGCLTRYIRERSARLDELTDEEKADLAYLRSLSGQNGWETFWIHLKPEQFFERIFCFLVTHCLDGRYFVYCWSTSNINEAGHYFCVVDGTLVSDHTAKKSREATTISFNENGKLEQTVRRLLPLCSNSRSFSKVGMTIFKLEPKEDLITASSRSSQVKRRRKRKRADQQPIENKQQNDCQATAFDMHPQLQVNTMTSDCESSGWSGWLLSLLPKRDRKQLKL